MTASPLKLFGGGLLSLERGETDEAVSPEKPSPKNNSATSAGSGSAALHLTDEEVVSGRFFLRQLCLSDKFFAMLAEDYLDRILLERSPQQSIANWNIIAACLADHGLTLNEEVTFRLMSGEPELAGWLTEDIHILKSVLDRVAADGTAGASSPITRPRWRVLQPTGQKETPLRQRLNPFVTAKDSGKPPTAIYVYDADKLSKMRTYVVAQTKELDSKLSKAREKKTQEMRAAEAATQQRLMEEQLTSVNLQKSDMLKLLEGLEAKFLADERKIHQIKKLTGLSAADDGKPAQAPNAAVHSTSDDGGAAAHSESPQSKRRSHAPRESPVRLRDTSKKPFEKPATNR